MYFLDELQCVDWDSDSDREDTNECNEFEDGESAVEISDSASRASSHSLTSEESVSELPKVRMIVSEFFILFMAFVNPSSRITFDSYFLLYLLISR